MRLTKRMCEIEDLLYDLYYLSGNKPTAETEKLEAEYRELMHRIEEEDA